MFRARFVSFREVRPPTVHPIPSDSTTNLNKGASTQLSVQKRKGRLGVSTFLKQGRGCKGKVASKQWWFPNKAGVVREKLHPNSGGFNLSVKNMCPKWIIYTGFWVQGLIDKNYLHVLLEHGLKKNVICWLFFSPCCSCCSKEKWTNIPGVILKDQQVHPIYALIVAKKTMHQNLVVTPVDFVFFSVA